MSKGRHNAFLQELWDPGKLWVQILFSMVATVGEWRPGFPGADLGEMKTCGGFETVLSYSRLKITVIPADISG